MYRRKEAVGKFARNPFPNMLTRLPRVARRPRSRGGFERWLCHELCLHARSRGRVSQHSGGAAAKSVDPGHRAGLGDSIRRCILSRVGEITHRCAPFAVRIAYEYVSPPEENDEGRNARYARGPSSCESC